MPSPLNDPIASRIVGYRHWTFSDEPLRSDVEVSKMMVRRIHHAKPRGDAATALLAKAKAAAEKATEEALAKIARNAKKEGKRGKKKKKVAPPPPVPLGDGEELDPEALLPPVAKAAAAAARAAVLDKPPSIKAVAKARAARAKSVPNLEGQVSQNFRQSELQAVMLQSYESLEPFKAVNCCVRSKQST